MANTAKRKKGPAARVDPRLAEKRAEKQMLAQCLREARLVKLLAGQLKRAIERSDAVLLDMSVFLDEHIEREARPSVERNLRQPEPANT
jgi:hypothetical protein